MDKAKLNIVIWALLIVFINLNVACAINNPDLLTESPDVLTVSSTPYTLELDQNEAFIAISKNDISAYNRAFPFYFYLETQIDYENQSDLSRWINQLFQKVSLISLDGSVFFTTSTMAWAPFKLEPNKFNLTLMVFPKDDNLSWTGVQRIERIVFWNGNDKWEVELPPYYVEERETIPETILMVTSSAMETSINDDLTAAVNWQISGSQKDILINEFKLDWPKVYSNLESYMLSDITDSNEGRTFWGYVSFKEQDDKIVFRPFIEVNYLGENVLLIPTVPVYINKSQN